MKHKCFDDLKRITSQKNEKKYQLNILKKTETFKYIFTVAFL